MLEWEVGKCKFCVEYVNAIKTLWEQFDDVPMDPETELMEAPFLHFSAGTPREEIWKWFDKVYPKGVHSLLYGE